jgi:hypothetical protein
LNLDLVSGPHDADCSKEPKEPVKQDEASEHDIKDEVQEVCFELAAEGELEETPIELAEEKSICIDNLGLGGSSNDL